jgi:hypothetical protein
LPLFVPGMGSNRPGMGRTVIEGFIMSARTTNEQVLESLQAELEQAEQAELMQDATPEQAEQEAPKLSRTERLQARMAAKGQDAHATLVTAWLEAETVWEWLEAEKYVHWLEAEKIQQWLVARARHEIGQLDNAGAETVKAESTLEQHLQDTVDHLETIVTDQLWQHLSPGDGSAYQSAEQFCQVAIANMFGKPKGIVRNTLIDTIRALFPDKGKGKLSMQGVADIVGTDKGTVSRVLAGSTQGEGGNGHGGPRQSADTTAKDAGDKLAERVPASKALEGIDAATVKAKVVPAALRFLMDAVKATGQPWDNYLAELSAFAASDLHSSSEGSNGRTGQQGDLNQAQQQAAALTA